MAGMPDRLRIEPAEQTQQHETAMREQGKHPEGRSSEELRIIAKGAGIAFAGKVIGGAAQYLYLILIARFIGMGNFGLFILALTVIEFIALVSRLGLDGGVVRLVSSNLARGEVDRVKGSIAAALAFSFISACAFGLISALGADHLSLWLFQKPSLAAPLQYLSLSIPCITLTVVALNATQGFQRMDYTFYGQHLFSPLCNITLGAFFLSMEPSPANACSAYSATACATAILSLVLLARAFPQHGRIETSGALGDLFRFGLPFLMVTLLMYLMMWTDTLIMGHFRSSDEVGVYTAAMKTAFVINTILLCFSHIFSPIISNLYTAGQLQRLHRLFKTVTRWTLTACIPFSLILMVFPREVMSVFGPGFAAGGTPLLILASAQLVNAATGPVAHMLVMSGRQQWMMLNTLAVCVVNFILNWLLVPSFGGTGAAVASSCSIVAFNILMLMEIRMLMGMHPYEASILAPPAAGFTAALFVIAVKALFTIDNMPLRLAVYGGISIVAYTGILCRGRLTDEDRIITEVIRQKWAAIRSGAA